MNKAIYPKAFMTPEGKPVSIRQFAKALKAIRQNRDALYPGWNWYPTPGYMILNSFRSGLNDRINRR